MAQTKKSITEFVQDAFCPMVAVLCSYDAETICRKNNLTFAELIQPFCRLPVEVSYRDPSSNLIVLKNFRIDIKDLNSSPPQSAAAKKVLSDSVNNTLTNSAALYEQSIESEQYQLKIRGTTPWFDVWRDTFLRINQGADHEFLKNFLSCIMIVSTSHLDPMDAFAKLLEQQTRQQQTSSKSTRWFMNNNIYKYFLLLHDVTEGEESRAVSVFSDLKQQYGAGNCHLLQINSKRIGQIKIETETNVNIPDPWRLHVKHSSQNALIQKESSMNDSISALSELIDQELSLTSSTGHPLSLSENSNSDLPSVTADENFDGSLTKSSTNIIHGACLTSSDHDRIHVFMSEFVVKGLLPWVENNLKMFNEQITSRRGITRIFSMPRRLLGGNSTSSQTQLSTSPSNSSIKEPMEFILRRAADLAFLFQNYELANHFYNTARKDASRDQGPAFYAGILEMCCLSNFMQDTAAAKSYPAQSMDEAIETYLLAAKLPLFATRAVLMSTEILKFKELYDQAVQQFLKLSHEDTEIRSALFLEQASYCFLNYRPPSIRKYAFHMVIAGHRFLKNGQRLHALRCYNDVLLIYGKPNWSLALDHINFTLGRQSAYLNHTNDAINSFHALFAPSNRMQSDQQQINFFREYLTFFNKLTTQHTSLPVLPIPTVERETMKVLLSGSQSPRFGGQVSNCNDFEFNETHEIWSELEKTLTAHDRQTIGSRTQTNLFTNRTNNQQNPIAVANEVVRVEFYLRNTLQVPLILSEVSLLWKYSSHNNQQQENISSEDSESHKESTNDKISIEPDPPVECDTIIDCTIFPNDTYKIELSCRPRHAGFVTLLGIRYRLNILAQNISDQTTWPYGVLGKTLFQVRGPRLNSTRSERINITYAIDRRLELQVIPETPLLQVEFVSIPEAMFCGEIQSCLVHLINANSNYPINRVRLATSQASLIAVTSLDDDHVLKMTDESELTWNPTFHAHGSTLQLVSPHHVLGENSTRTIRLWIKAPHVAGEMNIDFLFIYDSEQCQQPLRHRVVKHCSSLIVSNSLVFNAQCQSVGLDELLFPVQIDSLITTSQMLNIKIEQFSSISKQWTIENLSKFPQNSIQNGENLSLLFKCQRRSGSNDILHIKSFCLSNETSEKKNYSNVAENPIGDFFRHFVVENNSSNNTDRHKPATPILPPEISFLLLWKIEIQTHSGEKETRNGLHFLTPTIDINQIGTPEKTDCIQYDLIHPSYVEHKFTGVLSLPVELKLFNRTEEKVNIQMQLIRSTMESDSPSSSSCVWCGMTEQYFHLSPRENRSIPLRACFFKAGFYSLGNVALNRINQEKKISIPIKPNSHHYFIDIRAML